MLLNCGAGEDSRESLGIQEVKSVNPKGNQPWILIGRTDAEAEMPLLWLPFALTYWERPWCWERLKMGGEGDNRDGWMASPIQWTWVWVNSRSWWWTGKPGVLQSMRSQRVGHDCAIELNWFSIFRLCHWYSLVNHLTLPMPYFPTTIKWRRSYPSSTPYLPPPNQWFKKGCIRQHSLWAF